MSYRPRLYAAIMLVGSSCVSSGALPGTSAPDAGAGARHGAESIRLESPVDLEPYVGRRPMVRVKQTSYSGQSPSFDFVVFDDGAVFFEGKACVAEIGLRKAMLSEVELRGLKAQAGPRCAQLLRPTGEMKEMVMCTHADHAMVSCATGGDVRLGINCEGSELFWFASDLVEGAKVRKWIGTQARQASSCRSGKRFVAGEIDRMLGPAPVR
jgi:hypothetical protein